MLATTMNTRCPLTNRIELFSLVFMCRALGKWHSWVCLFEHYVKLFIASVRWCCLKWPIPFYENVHTKNRRRRRIGKNPSRRMWKTITCVTWLHNEASFDTFEHCTDDSMFCAWWCAGFCLCVCVRARLEWKQASENKSTKRQRHNNDHVTP